jgi:hypothetical protein
MLKMKMIVRRGRGNNLMRGPVAVVPFLFLVVLGLRNLAGA